MGVRGGAHIAIFPQKMPPAPFIALVIILRAPQWTNLIQASHE